MWRGHTGIRWDINKRSDVICFVQWIWMEETFRKWMETNKFPFESYLPFWNVKLGVSIANEWILRALEKLSDSNIISGMLKASPFYLSLFNTEIFWAYFMHARNGLMIKRASIQRKIAFREFRISITKACVIDRIQRIKGRSYTMTFK